MHTWLNKNNLQQGSMIFIDSCEHLFPESSEATVAIVISHDCDIARKDLNSEPYVEFLLGRIANKGDGQYEFAKNPRILHLEILSNGNTYILEIIAHKRYQILKEQLAAIEPNHDYKVKRIDILGSWLAARYRRQALPDSLVNRLKPVLEFLEKNGKTFPTGIIGFYFDIDPKLEELSSDQPYELWLYIVYRADYEGAEEKANDIAKRLNDIFNALIGKTSSFGTVILNECKAYSEHEFSLYDYRNHIEYWLEFISNKSSFQ